MNRGKKFINQVGLRTKSGSQSTAPQHAEGAWTAKSKVAYRELA